MSISIPDSHSIGNKANSYIIGNEANSCNIGNEAEQSNSSKKTVMHDHSAIIYSHFANITIAQKQHVLNRLLTLKLTYRSLQTLAQFHVGIQTRDLNSKNSILNQFSQHSCTDHCLVTIRDALNSGFDSISSLGTSNAKTARKYITEQIKQINCTYHTKKISKPSHYHFVHVQPPLLTNYLHSLLNQSSLNRKDINQLIKLHDCNISSRLNLKTISSLLMKHSCTNKCLITFIDASEANLPIQKSFDTDDIQVARSLCTESKKRDSTEIEEPSLPCKRQRVEDSSWPQILPDSEKMNIINEFRTMFTSDSFSRKECSFCSIAEQIPNIHTFHMSDLNIDILQNAVNEIRHRTHQQHIQPYKPSTIINDKYQVCHTCYRSIKKNKFVEIPLHAYSNNCWIGNIPNELQNLTFLEEQCIARARCTKCTVKIESGPTGQFKAKGNVCILSQEPGSLQRVLPPPINTLTDEIVVVFVASQDSEITADTLKKSPLLVRRSKIINALSWLKENNLLYQDVHISIDNLLKDYPENDVPKCFAIQQILRTDNEGVSYITDANNDLFVENPDRLILTSTAIIDTENVDSSYKSRKIFALKQLKDHNHPFIKFPSANTPICTWNNPSLYTYLWPTLFPYGTGLLEDPLRNDKNFGFRKIHLKDHIRHLLHLNDTRFQTHLTFIYVMMNIIQRRTTTYESKLACKRSYFPKISQALSKISVESLQSFEDKLRKQKHSLGETEGEKGILQLLKYVDYISENITGSTSELHTMREEIRSISREVGLPHLYITINPADFYNPIYQILAGRDINLNSIFDNMDHNCENIKRAKTVAENPIAGAKGFASLMNAFMKILLGTERNNKIGIFGKVKSYYGVVESQNRGSLHCHSLIWLEDALPPNIVKQKLLMEEQWKHQFLNWLENIISLDFPAGTTPYSPENMPYIKTPLMSTMSDPQKYYNTYNWLQDLRNILENTGQVHVHNNTCFKHLPKMAQKYKDANKDCRFQLPRPTVVESYCDENGHIHLKCSNGSMNGFNDICVSCLRCNMDIKYVGSGTIALAMIEYITNYITKLSLDTSTVFSALCAAIKALEKPSHTSNVQDTDDNEHSRLLLVKTCNSMIGKRELSGQQVGSFLCNIPNHYTNHSFQKVYWTKILQFTSGSLFDYIKQKSLSDEPIQEDDSNEPDNIDDNSDELFTDSYMILDKNNMNIQDRHSSIIDDIFYRPYEFEQISLWELLQNFKKEKIREKHKQSNSNNSHIFRFHPNHPLYDTHCLKRRFTSITPVLIGCAIPRRDKSDQFEKYAAAMLTLFKPWSRNLSTILKSNDSSWSQEYNDSWPQFKYEHQKIIDNMQSIYKCRDAAHDLSESRQQHLTRLGMNYTPTDNEESNTACENDPIWILGMQDLLSQENSELHENSLQIPLYVNEKDEQATISFYEIASASKVYSYITNHNYTHPAHYTTHQGTHIDIEYAKKQHAMLMKQKEYIINSHKYPVQNNYNPSSISDNLNHNSSNNVTLACLTTLHDEYLAIQEKLQQSNPIKWNSLLPYQRMCFILTEKYTFNKEQQIAFLLFADHYGKSLNTDIPPIRMLIAGPGGTGKSQIFDAIKEFFTFCNHSHHLKICAPTGLAANNIGGSTIHSEASLRVDKKRLYANTPKGRNLRENLENRWQHTTALICDEIFFLGAKDNSIMSTNLNIACNNSDNSPYGNLNILFAGDPAQLPPPCATSLYNRHAITLYKSGNFNTLKESDKFIAEGIFTWRQINMCIVLKQIMRQTEPHFQALLNRLRYGNCTRDDYTYLQQFVIQNRPEKINTILLSVANWIHDYKLFSPLICYTNLIRDVHNFKCAETFAKLTNQEYHYYHSYDTLKGSNTVLKNAIAEAAWNMRIKDANNLAGKLPLIPGMPVFLTENIVTELGLSNGSEGTLINVKWYKYNERRYPIYATVDFPSYKNPYSNLQHVIIQPINIEINFKYPKTDKNFPIKRLQLPIIPAFAYTAHNSQGRSLNAALIDLESCPNTATAYVMLSRIRSTSGISILRPFQFQKINSHIPQEIRNEIQRLDELHNNTIRSAENDLHWFYH